VIPAASATYDANDRQVGIIYDNNGNTTTASGVTYGYDFLNRLTSATNAGGIALKYDGDGNRVQETASGVTTNFLVDENNPTGYPQVVEELVGGVVQRQYTYGHALISQNQAAGVSFYGTCIDYSLLVSVNDDVHDAHAGGRSNRTQPRRISAASAERDRSALRRYCQHHRILRRIAHQRAIGVLLDRNISLTYTRQHRIERGLIGELHDEMAQPSRSGGCRWRAHAGPGI